MDTTPAIPPEPRTGRRHFAGPRLIRRLAGLLLWVGVIGAIAGVVGLLPLIAGELVLDRIGLGGAASAISAPPFSSPSGSLLVAALLLVLTEAFRRGTDLAQEIEGLV